MSASIYASSIHRTATFSDDRRYRYRLTRVWQNHHAPELLVFVMLNPSTADADQDDPTIRRCMGFAQRDGFDGISVVNLYAFRATDPKALLREIDAGRDAIGQGGVNDEAIRAAAAAAADVVCAWGTRARHGRDRRVLDLLEPLCRPLCLGTTQAGHPRHPLYVRADQALVDFEGAVPVRAAP